MKKRKPIDPDRLKTLARQGHSKKDIARILGMSKTGFYESLAADPVLTDIWKENSYENGRTEANFKI